MDQFGLLTLDGSTTYRSNVSGSHRSLNVAPPLFIGGVSDAVSLAPQALTVQGELDITPPPRCLVCNNCSLLEQAVQVWPAIHRDTPSVICM